MYMGMIILEYIVHVHVCVHVYHIHGAAVTLMHTVHNECERYMYHRYPGNRETEGRRSLSEVLKPYLNWRSTEGRKWRR